MSIGLRAGRATGLTVAESEESFTRIESMASWSRDGRAAYEAGRSSAVRFFPDKQLYERGRGFRFSRAFSSVPKMLSLLLFLHQLSDTYIYTNNSQAQVIYF